MTCASGEVCSGGACTVSCGAGLTNCSGVCRDLGTDRLNCGGCGNTCAAGQVCAGGSCQVSCSAGLTNCGGVCRDVSTDRNHCGGCGIACGSGEACMGGACVVSCPTGQAVCGGTCVDASSLSCGARIDLGTVGAGTSTGTELRRLPLAGQEDWFLVRFPETPDFRRHGVGRPRIRFATNEGDTFRLEIRATCTGGASACGSGGSATGRTDWSFNDSCTRSGTNCSTRRVGWPNAVLVRVTRRTGGTDCSRYSLSISR